MFNCRNTTNAIKISRPVFQEKFYNETAMSDHWGSIFYIDDNTLSYLDRSSCGVIDLRVSNYFNVKLKIIFVYSNGDCLYGFR